MPAKKKPTPKKEATRKGVGRPRLDAQEFAKNWQDLARELGYTRQQVDNWRKDPVLAPECPADAPDGRKHIARWRAFIEKHGLRGTEVPLDVQQKRRQAELKIEKEEFNLAILRGEYVRRDLIGPRITSLVLELFQELRRRLESSTPPLYQKCNGEPAECAAINHNELNQIQDLIERKTLELTK